MRHLNSWFPYEKPSRNKSCKHHSFIMGRKNIFRYVSNAQLSEWDKKEVEGVYKEIQRRAKKSGKNNGTK